MSRDSLRSPFNRLRWGSVALLTALTGGFATSAMAQDQQQQQIGTLEEIVVTARRRDESLQDVPIAITALDSNFLEQNNITEVADLRTQVPSLNISSVGSTSNAPQIGLRGLRPMEVLITLDPAVPMYFDEVVMTPTHGTNLAMYDLQQVQVLKGPQGTLFGRSSTGGAMLIEPRTPGQEFGGYLNLKAGNYDMYSLEGAVDLPVSDKVQFRVAGRALQRDGYQENVADNALHGEDYWDEDSFGGRISMNVQFTDNLQNLLVVGYDENEMKSRIPVPVAFNPESQLGQLADTIWNGGLAASLSQNPSTAPLASLLPSEPLIDQAVADQSTRDWQDIGTDLGAFDEVENTTVSNTTTWDLANGMTVKNIFGYRKLDYASANDVDGTYLPLFGSPADRASWVTPDPEPRTVESDQFSNELQLLGTAFEDRLEWLVGGYWYDLDGEETGSTMILGAHPDWPQDPTVNATLQNILFMGALQQQGVMDPNNATPEQIANAQAAAGVVSIAQNGFYQNSPNGEVDTQSYALFAEATYALSDKWDITLGARQTWDERSVTVKNSREGQCLVRDPAGNRLPPTACEREVSEDFSQPTWRVAANYHMQEGMMAYGTVSTGYRSGGFNLRGTDNATLEPFDEETVLTYELGHKADWTLGGVSSLRTNLAVYFSQYDDIQRTQDFLVDGALATTMVNAAEAEIKGAELDILFAPTDSLDLSLAYSYVDAEYKEWMIPTEAGPSVDQSDAPFIWIPEHSATGSIQYYLPVDAALGEISLMASAYWQDEVYTDANVSRNALLYSDEVRDAFLATEKADSYTVINLRADWRNMFGSSLDLGVFVNNVDDEEYVTGGLTVEDSQGFASRVYGPPRTYGASLNWTF